MEFKRVRRTAKRPDAILTSDWHIREDEPIGRTDNFWKAQWRKITYISGLQKKYGCPVIHAGDLFHHWKPSPYLLSKTMKFLPVDFTTVYGNHDLPQHNILKAEKCGIYTLLMAHRLTVLADGNWKERPEGHNMLIKGRRVLVWHTFTYRHREHWMTGNQSNARKILIEHPEADLIVTGDNHQSFSDTYDGRVLVNPGAITRQKTDEIKNTPCVWFYYVDTNTVEKVIIPHKEDIMSREHLEDKEERETRISAFIRKVDNNYKITSDFNTNLARFYKANQVRKPVKEIILKAKGE